MDELYGDILALLPLLRQAGQGEAARELLSAMTDACSPREILDNLRFALAEVEPQGAEAQALKARIEARVEALWGELPGNAT
jgi:hypothetical protein